MRLINWISKCNLFDSFRYLILVIISAGSIGLNANLSAPPRFDGAGYAVLGEALASGCGYREIDKPDAPRHDHFPPGYPAALALLWRFTGRSVTAAHIFSILCAVLAVVLATASFRQIYTSNVAFMLGLALAVNWTWARVGGSIQSEPFFMLCGFLAVVIALRAGRRGGPISGVALGIALAGSILVRHVGTCLTMAVAA